MSEELVRCTACRGTKKVAKLGGVVGDCNTCNGSGKIKSCDKPIMELNDVNFADGVNVIAAVKRVAPNGIDELETKVNEPANDVAETKRKVFKRKQG